MKVLLLNGSPHKDGCTATALRELGRTLNENGVETEEMWLGNKPVASCLDCGHCQKGQGCVWDDGVNALNARSGEFDGIVVGSPVYYGSPNGMLLSFLARLFFSAQGRWAGKLGAAVVSCRRGGASASYNQLNMFFGNNNLMIPTSQYWNQVHGFTPEDVAQDIEGLQTMRTLGRNMAWMLKGRELAGDMPPIEPWTPTHFIR